MVDAATMSASFLSAQLAKKREHRPFDFDMYYRHIEAHTWRSTIIPFSKELAEACVRYYKSRYNIGPQSPSLTSSRDAQLLRTLEAQIDREIKAASAQRQSGQCFIRMSNRSPKDGCPLDTSKFRRDARAELVKLNAELDLSQLELLNLAVSSPGTGRQVQQ